VIDNQGGSSNCFDVACSCFLVDWDMMMACMRSPSVGSVVGSSGSDIYGSTIVGNDDSTYIDENGNVGEGDEDGGIP